MLVNGADTYTTLASIQALGYGWESTGMITNPAFEDPTNNILYPTVQLSALMTIGAYSYGYVTGPNFNSTTWNIIAGGGHDNSGWYNPDGNVTLVSGSFQLTTGTSGSIWSPVYQFTSVQSVSILNISAIQVWPTNMVDSTLADIEPNYQTAEIRASVTSFNQNDGVIAWTTVKNNIVFSPPVIGYYVQVKLTLVNNDVPA